VIFKVIRLLQAFSNAIYYTCVAVQWTRFQLHSVARFRLFCRLTAVPLLGYVTYHTLHYHFDKRISWIMKGGADLRLQLLSWKFKPHPHHQHVAATDNLLPLCSTCSIRQSTAVLVLVAVSLVSSRIVSEILPFYSTRDGL